MKIVNRGYIIVKPKKAFVDWTNTLEEEFFMSESTEPNIYLIEDDFFEIEPILKSKFKMIFKNELISISDDEATYPEIKMEVFTEWFDCEIGSTVFDAQKNGLMAD